MSTVPKIAEFRDELAYCRAMQKWAAFEVDVRNNQRATCINDWVAEELLVGVAQ